MVRNILKLMALGIILFYCGDDSYDNRIIGAWHCDQGNKYVSTITFNKNATYEESGSNEGVKYSDKGRWSIMDNILNLKSGILPATTFDYRISGDSLIFTNMKIENNEGTPLADSFIFIRVK